MTDLEDVTAHLDALKQAPAPEVHPLFSRALGRFRFVPRADRRACADAFARWSSANRGDSSLALGLAVFMQAMDRFIAEELYEALHLLERARSILAALEDAEGIGLCAMLTGATYRTLGNFDLALPVSWEAFEVLMRSGRYPIFLAATANTLAGIHFDAGHLDEALEMYNITYRESTRADDFYFALYALQGLGRVYMLQGSAAEATDMFHRALELAERKQHPLHIANSLTELANFHFRAGHLDEAQALSEQALTVREEHRLLAGAVTNCLRLAEIHGARKQWPDARRHLDRALAAAEELKVKPKMAQAHQQLSQLYERLGDLPKSLEHYKRFHTLHEEVEREDNVRSLANAKAVFEAEQTRKENVVIRQQKAEIERKNQELQDTIDELTRARIGRKAKAMTLGLVIVLFVFQDAILRTALKWLASDNYFLLLAVKMAIIFSLSPINRGIEQYLLRKVTRKNRLARAEMDVASALGPAKAET